MSWTLFSDAVCRKRFSFWLENMKERYHLENLRSDGDNIKKGFKEVGFQGVGWINLDEDRNKWQEFFRTVINASLP